jgi:purine-binding chemotaxis protein CheW
LSLDTPQVLDGILEAAVTEVDGHHYALIVDGVEDVLEATSDAAPVRAAMGEGWERVSSGMVETEEGALLLLDVEGLVAGPEAARQAA